MINTGTKVEINFNTNALNFTPLAIDALDGMTGKILVCNKYTDPCRYLIELDERPKSWKGNNRPALSWWIEEQYLVQLVNCSSHVDLFDNLNNENDAVNNQW